VVISSWALVMLGMLSLSGVFERSCQFAFPIIRSSGPMLVRDSPPRGRVPRARHPVTLCMLGGNVRGRLGEEDTP